MVTWRTNYYLANRAVDLADVMLTVVNNSTGDSPNAPDVDERVNGADVVRNSLITDAEHFMSMDPARLEDEFNSQIRAANLSGDAEAMASLDLLQGPFNPTIALLDGKALLILHRTSTDQESIRAWATEVVTALGEI